MVEVLNLETMNHAMWREKVVLYWLMKSDVIIVNKVLRTLLPIYEIRVLYIQEMRRDPKNDITLDTLVGRLTTFELDNFDNYLPGSRNIESTFKAKLTLGRKGGNSKGK